MALVLCTGIDNSLMMTQKMILENAGHNVVLALGASEVVPACKESKFAIAVIGQAITIREKERILSLIRKHCPSAKVLELYPSYIGKILHDADAWLEVPVDVPTKFAETITALLATRPKN